MAVAKTSSRQRCVRALQSDVERERDHAVVTSDAGLSRLFSTFIESSDGRHR